MPIAQGPQVPVRPPAGPTPAADLRRAEAGFAWFESMLARLDDTRLRNTIYDRNKEFAQVRLRVLRNEVMFLFHALGIRDEHP